MRATSRTPSGLRLCTAAGLAGSLLLAGACASTPPAPTRSLDSARTAVTNAEKAEAGRYAAVELGEAREKLASADSAVVAKNMVGAERLADQARVEAELASARTEMAKAVAVNKEMALGGDALNEEMQRAGDKQ
ncbi:MAG: DUF4398 domain-containing protein [Gammaproteobacteria bacterium]